MDELQLLREAISNAQCNICESEFYEGDDWVLVDWTEFYDPLTDDRQRPSWMRNEGVWEVVRTALLCASCAAEVTTDKAWLDHHTPYRNHRGPGAPRTEALSPGSD